MGDICLGFILFCLSIASLLGIVWVWLTQKDKQAEKEKFGSDDEQ